MGSTPLSARRPVVAFVVTGGLASAMAERARSFASRLAGDIDPRLVCAEGRRSAAVARLLRDLFAARPEVCYVLDIAAAPVIAGGAYQAATGTPLVIDFGDAVVELGQALAVVGSGCWQPEHWSRSRCERRTGSLFAAATTSSCSPTAASGLNSSPTGSRSISSPRRAEMLRCRWSGR